MSDVPALFRVTFQVSDLDKAAGFYSRLLGMEGRRIRGARHYFDCGAVILALVDPTGGGAQPQPMADCVYLRVKDLEGIHARARELGCLDEEPVHGQSGGEIATRPWGERSFYTRDAVGNCLCFVDERTLFTGR